MVYVARKLIYMGRPWFKHRNARSAARRTGAPNPMAGKLTDRQKLLDEIVRRALPISAYRPGPLSNPEYSNMIAPWIKREFLLAVGARRLGRLSP